MAGGGKVSPRKKKKSVAKVDVVPKKKGRKSKVSTKKKVAYEFYTHYYKQWMDNGSDVKGGFQRSGPYTTEDQAEEAGRAFLEILSDREDSGFGVAFAIIANSQKYENGNRFYQGEHDFKYGYKHIIDIEIVEEGTKPKPRSGPSPPQRKQQATITISSNPEPPTEEHDFFVRKTMDDVVKTMGPFSGIEEATKVVKMICPRRGLMQRIQYKDMERFAAEKKWQNMTGKIYSLTKINAPIHIYKLARGERPCNDE